MKKPGSNKKVANRLVAVSSAAVMAVYAAGYTRTRSAADQLEGQSAERRPPMPLPARITSPVADSQPAALVPAASAAPENVKPQLIASVIPPAAKKANAADPAVTPVPAPTAP